MSGTDAYLRRHGTRTVGRALGLDACVDMLVSWFAWVAWLVGFTLVLFASFFPSSRNFFFLDFFDSRVFGLIYEGFDSICVDCGRGMALVMDEQLATLLLQHCMADVREGWNGWDKLCLVNRACARVFRLHASQLVNFCFSYMHLLIEVKNRELREKDRQLWHWMKNCSCAPFVRDSGDDSDAGNGSEAELVDGAISPSTSVEY
jgi:hypothetical protein